MRDRSEDRLYALLPEHVRVRDVEEGRPLNALMRILAKELEVVESDVDALYANWFIETCEDWVVPYIGELVGARALRPFGEGGGSLRAYVANTLTYRQGKGTIAVLEQLARDVSGWPAHAVEFFRRLIQSQNVNHVRADNHGTMSLRDADAASQVGRVFERAAHTVEVGSIASGEGRYNIPNVGIFLWRLQSFFVPYSYEAESGYRGAVVPRPSALGAAFRHFDILGRDIPVFNRARTEPTLAHLATERDLPGPLRIRPLYDDLNALRDGVAGGGAWFEDPPVLLVRLDGAKVEPDKLHCCNLTEWRQPDNAGHVHFDPVLGRMSLHNSDKSKTLEVSYAYGAAHDIGGGPYDRRASIEAWAKPFRDQATSGPALVQIGVSARAEEVTNDPLQGGPVVESLAEAVTRWNADVNGGKRWIITIMDSGSYGQNVPTVKIPSDARLAIVAAGWPARKTGGGARERTPGILAPQDRRPHVKSNLRVEGTAAADHEPGSLIIDGLFVEGTLTVKPGNLGQLDVRHSTLGAKPEGLKPGLEVQSSAGKENARFGLILDHVVTGRVRAQTAAGTFAVCDSILGEDKSANPDPTLVPLVLDAEAADLHVTNSTIFGRVKGRTLAADATIFVGPPTIARRQAGCVRFCYVPDGARTPRRYRCVPDLQLAQLAERLGRPVTPSEAATLRRRLLPVFTSSAHGQPAFGQLAETCPQEIAEGAEAGAEIGAMHGLGNPARVANLRDALDEYLPFGLEAGLIFVT